MATAKFMTWAHEGYLDGYYGRDPNPRFDGSNEYEAGWLQGVEDSENGVSIPSEECPLKKGDRVTIPKGTPIHSTAKGNITAGRTYVITLHNVEPGVQAHVDSYGDFVRPKGPTLVWPGTSGYWSRALYEDVVIHVS